MLDKIMDIKEEVMERLEKLADEHGFERMDAKELVDAVKDLAEAEYYCSVVEAMDGSGYMPEDMGYEDMGYRNRQGYRGSNGRYRSNRRGYRMGHMDSIETIREELRSATADEREQLKQELRKVIGM